MVWGFVFIIFLWWRQKIFKVQRGQKMNTKNRLVVYEIMKRFGDTYKKSRDDYLFTNQFCIYCVR